MLYTAKGFSTTLLYESQFLTGKEIHHHTSSSTDQHPPHNLNIREKKHFCIKSKLLSYTKCKSPLLKSKAHSPYINILTIYLLNQ